MASRGLPPVAQLGRRALIPKNPTAPPDFAPPPPYPVVWLIVDRVDGTNRTTSVAQTAYKAYEQSGIQRDGLRLSYGECDVSYSDRGTQAMWLEALVGGLQALHELSLRATKKKSNGKLNGHASK